MKFSDSIEPLPLFPPQSLTITNLTRYLRELLESDEILRDVWVLGEISNFTRATSGHCYFSLKDAQAQVRCAFFRHKAQFAGKNTLARQRMIYSALGEMMQHNEIHALTIQAFTPEEAQARPS